MDKEPTEPDARQAFWKTVFEKERKLHEENWKPEGLENQEQFDPHVAEAIKSLRKAIEMDPDKPIYHLTLACVYHKAIDVAVRKRLTIKGETMKSREETADDAAAHEEEKHAIKTAWLQAAANEYLEAHDLAFKDESKLRHRPVAGLTELVSYESARGYLGLRRMSKNAIGDDKVAGEMEKTIKKMEALPIGAITPIVLSLEPREKLSDLLAVDTAVTFDMAGDGRAGTWPWLKPDVALLVWDPHRRGQITSGQQLFGSVTFWLTWRDGYAAMDSLDDNRDGQLAGSELTGLALWFDRNSNGRSDRGEVVPIEQTDIAALATRATGRDGDAPMNAAGLRLKNGKTLPTWDWVVEPIE